MTGVRTKGIYIKTKEEIERMRRAGRAAARALRVVAAAVRPGIPTAYLDRVAEEAIRREGGIPSFRLRATGAFPPTSACP